MSSLYRLQQYWLKNLQAALCDTFAHNPSIWTYVPFVDQPPRFICSPKIWFYENRTPDENLLF